MINTFRIGSVHGKLNPGGRSEAKIRNDIFLIGFISVEVLKGINIPVRLVGYEMPTKKNNRSRDECIDLFGYDNNHKPYIIEVKRPTAKDNINDVIEQICRYEKQFINIYKDVESEIKIKYNWKNFRFSDGVGKIILSGRSFYMNKRKEGTLGSYRELGIYMCSFARISNDKDSYKLLDKFGSKGILRLKIENR